MNAQNISRFVRENPETVQQGQERIHSVLARSATDKAFRQWLMTDPRAAIADATGETLPEGYRVQFVENTADATIVLPDFVDASAELSDHELESVAGGSEPVAITLAIFAASMMVGVTIAKVENGA